MLQQVQKAPVIVEKRDAVDEVPSNTQHKVVNSDPQSNLSSAMCIEFNGKFLGASDILEKLMSEDLMRGEESLHRNSEAFNLESDFKGNISVSEDRPLQME